MLIEILPYICCLGIYEINYVCSLDKSEVQSSYLKSGLMYSVYIYESLAIVACDIIVFLFILSTHLITSIHAHRSSYFYIFPDVSIV